MILPDTSIWIDLIRDPAKLRAAGDRYRNFVMCGPILQEVLQGLEESKYADQLRDAMLTLPRLCDPMPMEVFLKGAELFSEGRRRGYTIRSTVDCLIAAVAIENNATVWHRDPDFTMIARYAPLRILSDYLT